MAEKRNEAVFWALNMLVLLRVLQASPSLRGGMTCIGAGLVLWYCTVLKSDQSAPAFRQASLFLFADSFVIMVIFYHILRPLMGRLDIRWEDTNFTWWVYLLVCCFLMIYGLGLKNYWGLLITICLVALAAVCLLFGSGSMVDMDLGREGIMLLILFVVLGCVWTGVGWAIDQVNKEHFGNFACMSLALLAVFIVLCVREHDLVSKYVRSLPENWDRFTNTYLSDWTVLYFIVSILSGIYVLSAKKEKRNALDVLFLSSVLGFICLLWITVHFYVPFNWVFLLIYWYIGVRSLGKSADSEGEKYFSSCKRVMAVFAFWATVDVLLSTGLWLLTFFLLLLFYTGFTGQCKKDMTKRYFLVLAGMAGASILWIWHYRLSPDNLLAWGIGGSFAVLTLLIISLPHPANLSLGNKWKAAVCMAFVVFILVPMFRYGSRVSVVRDGRTDYAVIRIEAVGEGNTVDTAVCFWTDSLTGDRKGYVQLNEGEQRVKIQGECLSIITTDQKGVRTLNTKWFPYAFEHLGI